MERPSFIPGYRFGDITKKDFRWSTQIQWENGLGSVVQKSTGIGCDPLDVDSILYKKPNTATRYNPELTYGIAKDSRPKPMKKSHFIEFDGKCLAFLGFTRQTVMESALEKHRIRRVKVLYFLVDDTISVVEPVLDNAGYAQGCILKRGQIPNPNRKNRFWHWSDLNNGVELNFYGVTYRLCNCDKFTEQFLSQKGNPIAPAEPIPEDPYFAIRRIQQEKEQEPRSGQPCNENDRVDEEIGLRRFLEFEGRVLRFWAMGKDYQDDEVPEWKFYKIFYFLLDNRVSIYEEKEEEHFKIHEAENLQFLNRSKIPKDGCDLPTNFPSEARNKEPHKYYEAKDFIIGKTVLLLGHRFLLYDCDKYTRGYFKDILGIEQPDTIDLTQLKSKLPPRQRTWDLPEFIGIGSPEDTRQNVLLLQPKPPKVWNFLGFVVDEGKKLRYKVKKISAHPNDELRNFIMEFNIGTDEMNIYEWAARNSGFRQGRFMAATRLRKPGTVIDDDVFYGPKDFAIGADVYVRGSVFRIVEMDVYTYNYMENNKHKFTREALDGAREFMKNKNVMDIQKDKEKDEEKTKVSTCRRTGNQQQEKHFYF